MIRIGTRDSKLAVWQAEHVASALRTSGVDSTLVYIKTEGDLVLDTPLPLMGGKGVFTKALDEALLRGDIDIAVHSHKDIPTQLPDQLAIIAVFEREDPRDVLVVRAGHPLTAQEIMASELAVVATSSMRRQGQWLHRHPQHTMVDIRGNVQTRLRKLDEGDWDGVIFAAAGLLRLGLHERIGEYLDWMLCAPAQGAVAVMARDDDGGTKQALAAFHHHETALCVAAERRCLRRLEGGCSAPVGVYVRRESDKFTIFANVLSTDGQICYDTHLSAPASDEAAVGALGERAADALLTSGAATLL